MKLPRRYTSQADPIYARSDNQVGISKFARSALQTYRSSYLAMPTASNKEFIAFFSEDNFFRLMREVLRRTTFEANEDEMYETMMYSFSVVAPRSDEMDPRRLYDNEEVTESYLEDLNNFTLERVCANIVAANGLWKRYTHLLNYGRKGFDASLPIDAREYHKDTGYDGYKNLFHVIK